MGDRLPKYQIGDTVYMVGSYKKLKIWGIDGTTYCANGDTFFPESAILFKETPEMIEIEQKAFLKGVVISTITGIITILLSNLL